MASSQKSAEHNIALADDTDDRNQRVQRAQWLRAAILGANDGLLSTTSLMLGIGAAKDDRRSMILSGLAGALAGACSMAVGEFASVSTQRDIEQAIAARCNAPCRKLNCETTEKISPSVIIVEPNLTQVLSPKSRVPEVIDGGLDSKAILTTPSVQDHMEEALPNPYKAAAASALAFLCGSVLPLASAAFIPQNVIRIVVITAVTSIALALFGGFGAHLGGSAIRESAARVLVGGWIAMAITYSLLKPFDTDHE